MTDFIVGFLGLVAVFALSMGGFSRARNLPDGHPKKNEIWLGALKLAIGAFVIGFIFLA
jgi:hypothetical protein